MVDVIVEVKEPFNISNGRPPLTPGMFVKVRIKGKMLPNVIRLPRHTIHNGSFVWLEEDGKLSIRKVTIARFNSDYAYITDGIADGDTVITSPLDTVTDGMLIRTNLIVPQEKPNE
jgi:multidrug efflux pump subunit AcrA (membrane-fusion protein)